LPTVLGEQLHLTVVLWRHPDAKWVNRRIKIDSHSFCFVLHREIGIAAVFATSRSSIGCGKPQSAHALAAIDAIEKRQIEAKSCTCHSESESIAQGDSFVQQIRFVRRV
jgi:hypothetical protein